LKGSPLREFFLVLLAGALLTIPLFFLTRPPLKRAAAPALPAAEAETFPVWFALRFSHPPERFTLRQGDTVLAQGGGLLRVEDDLHLSHTRGQLLLQLSLEWPGDISSAYAELSLAPDELPEQRQGFWAKGIVTRTLEFQWTPLSP